jgi:hypothetical protein
MNVLNNYYTDTELHVVNTNTHSSTIYNVSRNSTTYQQCKNTQNQTSAYLNDPVAQLVALHSKHSTKYLHVYNHIYSQYTNYLHTPIQLTTSTAQSPNRSPLLHHLHDVFDSDNYDRLDLCSVQLRHNVYRA